MTLYILLGILAVGFIFALLAEGRLGSPKPGELPRAASHPGSVFYADKADELKPDFIAKEATPQRPFSLVFAYETLGYQAASANEGYSSIVSLCYQLVDANHKVIRERTHYIKPKAEGEDDLMMLDRILYDRLAQEGEDAAVVWTLFLAEADKAERLVGHNLEALFPTLLYQIEQCGLQTNNLRLLYPYCTMERGMDVAHMSDARGDWRYPRLSELYGTIRKNKYYIRVKTDYPALTNCRMTADCYHFLLNRDMRFNNN